MNILNGKRTVANPVPETCAELYERLNAGYGMTLRNFQERFNARSETRFGMKRVATSKEVAIMESLYPPKQEKLKRVTATETPGAKASPANLKKKNPTDWHTVIVRGLFGGGTIAHSGLVWSESAYLWSSEQTPILENAGFIAGSVMFLFILGAVVMMWKSDNQDILWFVWFLDIISGFIHFHAMYHGSTTAYAAGIKEYGTGVFALSICVIAGALVYFYRQTGIKPDKK